MSPRLSSERSPSSLFVHSILDVSAGFRTPNCSPCL
jgi:hypothetical protein